MIIIYKNEPGFDRHKLDLNFLNFFSNACFPKRKYQASKLTSKIPYPSSMEMFLEIDKCSEITKNDFIAKFVSIRAQSKNQG